MLGSCCSAAARSRAEDDSEAEAPTKDTEGPEAAGDGESSTLRRSAEDRDEEEEREAGLNAAEAVAGRSCTVTRDVDIGPLTATSRRRRCPQHISLTQSNRPLQTSWSCSRDEKCVSRVECRKNERSLSWLRYSHGLIGRLVAPLAAAIHAQPPPRIGPLTSYAATAAAAAVVAALTQLQLSHSSFLPRRSSSTCCRRELTCLSCCLPLVACRAE